MCRINDDSPVVARIIVSTFIVQFDSMARHIIIQEPYIFEYSVALIHWGRVTHICVRNLTIIGSDKEQISVTFKSKF